MKTAITPIPLLMVYLGLASGCAKKQPPIWESIQNPEVVAQLKSYVAEKKAQAKAAGGDQPREFAEFFSVAQDGDWLTVSNMFTDFLYHAPEWAQPFQYPGRKDDRFTGTAWEAVKETRGALEAFGVGDEKYSAAYARSIIDSIPPGSIYFGGTDPGRFLVSGMEKSQVNGDPFFIFTQNALTSNAYLDYLRAMYGDKIFTPTTNDAANCFEVYVKDVQRRMDSHQLEPEVNLQTDRVQVNGQVAGMELTGLLAKIIIDRNTNREFYVEESSPINWMYPYLEPHGIIFKVNRQPLMALSDEIVQRDRDYWMKLTAPMIGDWLKPDTTIEKASSFAEQVFAKKDFSGFTGDLRFVQNGYSHKMFSKERSAIGGLYAWRAQHATTATEKQRMDDAADFAFRQAWVLCPYSPEATFRYVNFLVEKNRFSDAQLLVKTAERIPELKEVERTQMTGLMEQLQNIQRQMKGK